MSKLVGLVVVLFTSTLSFALPARDTDFECTPIEKARKYETDFRIDVASFGGRELCNSNVDTKKLYNDFELVELGQFGPATESSLIGQFINPNQYYPWLKSQTESVRRGNDIPYATAYNSFGHFTMQDGWALLPTLGRVGTVIHEARHTEGYGHTQCFQGPYEGSRVPGCDRRFSDGGSHAVEMEYYARTVLLGTNFHPLYQKMARLMVIARSNFVFNAPVISPKEGLVVSYINNQQKPSVGLILGQELLERGESVNGALKRSSFGASFISGFTSIAIDLYANNNNNEQSQVRDDYAYFKLLAQTDRWPSGVNMNDVEEIDLGVHRYFMAIGDNKRVYNYNFSQGQIDEMRVGFEPHRFVTQVDNQKGLYIVDTQNAVHSFKNNSWTQLGTWPEQTKTYVTAPTGETLKLGQQGQLLNQDGSPYTVTSGLNIDQAVNVPIYDAFKVEK